MDTTLVSYIPLPVLFRQQ